MSSEAVTLRVGKFSSLTGFLFSNQPYLNELAPTPVAEHENDTCWPRLAVSLVCVIVTTGF